MIFALAEKDTRRRLMAGQGFLCVQRGVGTSRVASLVLWEVCICLG